MYGHGAPPPPGGEGKVIPLRVLFMAAGFLSCGLLSCVPLFRVAFLRGRGADWLLAWLSLPVSIGCLAVVGSLPESDRRTDVALALVILVGAASAVHFLMVDIRHHQRPSFAPAGPGSYPPRTAPPQATAYGYPQQPYAAPLPPRLPDPPQVHALPTQTAGQTPVPPPQHQPRYQQPQPHPQAHPQPQAHRIDQVRAELDELSDYLRRQGGGPGTTGGTDTADGTGGSGR